MGDLGVQEKLGRYDEVHEHATKALLVFPDRPLVEAYNKLCNIGLTPVCCLLLLAFSESKFFRVFSPKICLHIDHFITSAPRYSTRC